MTKAMLIVAGILAAAPVCADEASDTFVEANILGIFYHELGHALIDTENLPVFGQEEDAADVFSILLVDSLYDHETAVDMAYDVANGFWGEALVRDQDNQDVAWWDVHGPDEQRFYNTVCLFYGADPDAREDFAADMDLPQERADYCYDEFSKALDSWGSVLDDMAERKSGGTLEYAGGSDSLTEQIIEQEVAALNAEFRFAHPVTISVESCGEANAFYDPQDRAIVMCTEFEDHLRAMADLL